VDHRRTWHLHRSRAARTSAPVPPDTVARRNLDSQTQHPTSRRTGSRQGCREAHVNSSGCRAIPACGEDSAIGAPSPGNALVFSGEQLREPATELIVRLQRLYGLTVPFLAFPTPGGGSERDMHPRTTNLQRRARDAC
jgi:hypothetical protein